MKLPISNYKNEILKAVLTNMFTIISAHPASGKSTLVPQYLAEVYDKVIITNPRVMPCITLATYVAEQMGEELGEYVGYRTGFKRCSSENTVIEYVTDAFQLVRSIFNENKDKRLAIVIDEVHEWTQATESLVAWCKFMSKKWNAKIVIMSATMATEKLSSYLGANETAVLQVPGKIYEVKVEERYKNELIDTILEKIVKGRNTLVFLPTQKQIHSVMDELKERLAMSRGIDAVILPLHGELSWEEQRKCYRTYLKPLVILSTNIAQTSVTIPGINSVVDTGTAIVPTAVDGVVEYRLTDISKADITQRMWRAGRMEDGDYTLCSDTSIEERMEYPIPEIRRSLLDQTTLKLASIGIDIEELEFFHQPEEGAIKAARKELMVAGALDENGEVTEIGYKISKMPISTKKARMIIEAEKYGVVKEVITIAAIVEVGGLLLKVITYGEKDSQPSYSDFTSETTSDLLAELDIWNYLTRLNYIDFRALGINKRNFYHAKDHMEKIYYAIDGMVEISSSDNREAILLACLSTQTSNIHTYSYSGKYYGEDEETRGIDRKSCLNDGFIGASDCIIGTPIRISYKNERRSGTFDILTFATKVNASLLLKLVPDRIEFKEELIYSDSKDAVLVVTRGNFRGIQVSYDSYIDYQHPEHARLKAEFQREHDSSQYSLHQNQYASERKPNNYVVIDGKIFETRKYYNGEFAKVYLNAETIFTTETNEAFLDDGQPVYFVCNELWGRKCRTISELRKALELKYRARLVNELKDEHESKTISSIRELSLKQGRLGEVQLYEYFGIHKHSFGNVYICLKLNKATVYFKVVEDEETANSNTLEAIQHLFKKEVDSLYGESKFSHLPGKKKKVLTPEEKATKADFDTLVRDVLRDLTVSNASENLEFLAEYYQELMAK